MSIDPSIFEIFENLDISGGPAGRWPAESGMIGWHRSRQAGAAHGQAWRADGGLAAWPGLAFVKYIFIK